jgi:hypothetical protein
MTKEIIFSDATKLAELIRTKEVWPVAVMQAHLDRIAAVNPKINAIVTLADGALKAAKAAEVAVLGGDEIGPLHGVPFTVKDSIDTGCGDPARLADLQGARSRRRRNERRTNEEGRRHPAREDQPSRILVLDRER